MKIEPCRRERERSRPERRVNEEFDDGAVTAADFLSQDNGLSLQFLFGGLGERKAERIG
jgi:hypothetical protein